MQTVIVDQTDVILTPAWIAGLSRIMSGAPSNATRPELAIAKVAPLAIVLARQILLEIAVKDDEELRRPFP